MGVFFDIEQAMQTKLLSVNNHPFIQFESMKPYKPVLGVRYWRTNNNAGNTLQVTADGMRNSVGIYQVDIIVPVGQGLKVMLQDMDDIAAAFDTIYSLVANGTKIQIEGCSRTRVSREEAWLYGSVKILYNCYSY